MNRAFGGCWLIDYNVTQETKIADFGRRQRMSAAAVGRGGARDVRFLAMLAPVAIGGVLFATEECVEVGIGKGPYARRLKSRGVRARRLPDCTSREPRLRAGPEEVGHKGWDRVNARHRPTRRRRLLGSHETDAPLESATSMTGGMPASPRGRRSR